MSYLSRPWLVESIRFTLFPLEHITGADLNWWSEVVGQPPEQKISQPRIGGVMEVGPFASAQLVLQIAPPRVDWNLIPIPNQANDNLPLTVDRFPASWDTFISSIKLWFHTPTCPIAKRIAFSSALILPIANLEEGYNLLVGLLPSVTLDPNNTADFLYQINRPRNSSIVPGIKINRLSNWAVLNAQQTQIFFGPGTIPEPTLGQENLLIRTVLDISTPQQFMDSFSPSNLPEMLDELKTMAQELVINGDIP